MNARELYFRLSEMIPPSLSCEWDNDGLMVEASDKEIKKVLVTLDITEKTADHAIKNGYDCIISHHPLIFHPLKALSLDSVSALRAIKLLKHGVSAMSFHTRLDALDGGIHARPGGESV